MVLGGEQVCQHGSVYSDSFNRFPLFAHWHGEDAFAARLQHSPDFAESRSIVPDVFEHFGGSAQIERCIGISQVLDVLAPYSIVELSGDAASDIFASR